MSLQFDNFENYYNFSCLFPPLMKLPSSSMGRGKIMVEFFSAEMVARVCRYLHTATSQGQGIPCIAEG